MSDQTQQNKTTIWLNSQWAVSKKDGVKRQYFIGEMMLAKREFAQTKKIFAKVIKVMKKDDAGNYTDYPELDKDGNEKVVIALDFVEKTGI